jgi:hypothetical protein
MRTIEPPMTLPTIGLPWWLCFGNVVVVAAPADVTSASQRTVAPSALER